MSYYENIINELKQYEDGWLEGQGKKINIASINTMNYIVEKINPDFTDFGLFPTEDGNVQIENDNWEIEAYPNNTIDYLFMKDEKVLSKEGITVEEFIKDYFEINN